MLIVKVKVMLMLILNVILREGRGDEMRGICTGMCDCVYTYLGTYLVFPSFGFGPFSSGVLRTGSRARVLSCLTKVLERVMIVRGGPSHSGQDDCLSSHEKEQNLWYIMSS